MNDLLTFSTNISLITAFDLVLIMKVTIDGVTVGLDSPSSDVCFLSHAHSDHLIRRNNYKILCSEPTKELAEHRTGLSFNAVTHDCSVNGLRFKMLDSGHVPGSRSLLIQGEKKIFFTGDFTNKPRFFLKALEPVKCDTLIIESTYGLPEYIFPEPKEVFSQARDYINDELRKGNSLLLMAYALGKAQLISKLVEDFDNVFVHESVQGINDVCRKHGFEIPVFDHYSKLNGSPSIVIAPQHGSHHAFTQKLKRKNFRAVAFSGWALNDLFKYSLGVDECFPLSDHADFEGLLRVVKACKASEVLTYHGFASEFANFLRLEGINAKPLE